MSKKSLVLFLFFVIYSFVLAGDNIPFLNISVLSSAYAEKGSFELGGVFGTPSGLNARYWMTDRFGLDAIAGISLNKYPAITLDLLLNVHTLYSSSTWESFFFIGMGAFAAKEENGLKESVRFPFGLSFPSLKYPFDVSIYMAPAVVIKPERELELNWGIGIRYNFTSGGEMRERQDDLEYQTGVLERDVEDLKKGLGTTKGKLSLTEGELKTTKGKLSQTEGELGSTKGKLALTEGELSSTKGKLSLTEGELSSTKGKLVQTQGELSAVKSKLDDMTGTLMGIKQKLDRTEGELGTTKNKLYLTAGELDETKNQLDNVKSELNTTKKTLDNKQNELNLKQTELTKAKNIIENAFTGKEKEEEEKKLAIKQKDLDRQVAQLKTEKKSWDKIKEREGERRTQLNKKCEERGGIIDENGYCNCPQNQEWDPKTDKCVCIKGYYRNKQGEECKPCEIIKQNGECADGGCRDYEVKVVLKGSPHKYVCVRKCRKPNEVWSKNKNTCVCKDGFYRDENGECVQRQ